MNSIVFFINYDILNIVGENMKEDKNHLNGKQKISLGLLAILLLSLIGMSFAYFTAQVSGNDTAKKAKVESGTMSLPLGGMKEVECLNIYPGQTCVVNFSVETFKDRRANLDYCTQ